MTFEDDAQPRTTQDALAALSNWVELIRTQTAVVAERALALEEAQHALNLLTLTQVPEAMEEAGLTELKLEDGAKLTIKKDLKVNISEVNRRDAFAWLRSAGHDLAIRQMLTLDLRPLPLAERGNILHTLEEEFHTEPAIVEDIHNATLKSIVSAALEAGQTVPRCVTVHEFRRAIVKEKKG